MILKYAPLLWSNLNIIYGNTMPEMKEAQFSMTKLLNPIPRDYKGCWNGNGIENIYKFYLVYKTSSQIRNHK